MFGQATFLGLIKSIRSLSFKDMLEGLSYYVWETSGFLILIFLAAIFHSVFSFTFVFLSLGYFWCWSLSSPNLVQKAHSKRYKFSILKVIVNFERTVREVPAIQNLNGRAYFKPFSRVLSVSLFGLVMFALLKENFLAWFAGGGMLYEFFLLLRVKTR